MLYNLLLLLIYFLLGLMLLVGLFLVICGLFRKNKNNGLTKLGIGIATIPSLFLLYHLFFSLFASKPNQQDLVGVYHITETTISFDKSTYDNYRLEFKEDSTFTLTPVPDIEVPENGRYEIDYESGYNEVLLRCSNVITSAHIERRIGSFRIEFIIGDPDSGASIYFEKIKN